MARKRFLGVSCAPTAGAALGEVLAGSRDPQAMGSSNISTQAVGGFQGNRRSVWAPKEEPSFPDTCAQMSLLPQSSQGAKGGSAAEGEASIPGPQNSGRARSLELGHQSQRWAPSLATCWLCGLE